MSEQDSTAQQADDELLRELSAITSIRDSLAAFTTDQRGRILSYVMAALEVTKVASMPDTGSAHPEERSTASSAPMPIDTKRFFAVKKPSSDIERVLVLASCVVAGGETFFDSARLSDERVRSASAPFNVIEAAKSAVKKGYFASAGEGKRQITVLGEEVAEALPDREAVAAILSSTMPRSSQRRRR